jgi:hypothetical protein
MPERRAGGAGRGDEGGRGRGGRRPRETGGSASASPGLTPWPGRTPRSHTRRHACCQPPRAALPGPRRCTHPLLKRPAQAGRARAGRARAGRVRGCVSGCGCGQGADRVGGGGAGAPFWDGASSKPRYPSSGTNGSLALPAPCARCCAENTRAAAGFRARQARTLAVRRRAPARWEVSCCAGGKHHVSGVSRQNAARRLSARPGGSQGQDGTVRIEQVASPVPDHSAPQSSPQPHPQHPV